MTRRIMLILILLSSVTVVLAQSSGDTIADAAENKIESVAVLDVNKNDFWNLQYHPQVTTELFKLIEYPYFPGGKDFEQKGSISVGGVTYAEDSIDSHKANFKSGILIDIAELREIIREQEAEQNIKKPADLDEDMDSAAEPPSEKLTEKEVVPNEDMELAFDGIQNAPSGDIIESRNYLEKCSDLIYKWRRVNESPVFMLEVLRSVELIKTESGVYNTAPEVAVQVKRVLGTIARINKNFDFTCRVTMEAVLVGDYPRAWLSRLEKQLADLQIRAAMLVELNDKGSESLGLGKIDRSYDNIPYQKVEFIRIKEPDKYER